jgi:hypothetical protein
MKALLRDFLRTANESPAAMALGALLGIGGAAVLVGLGIALVWICHFGR